MQKSAAPNARARAVERAERDEQRRRELLAAWPALAIGFGFVAAVASSTSDAWWILAYPFLGLVAAGLGRLALSLPWLQPWRKWWWAAAIVLVLWFWMGWADSDVGYRSWTSASGARVTDTYNRWAGPRKPFYRRATRGDFDTSYSSGEGRLAESGSRHGRWEFYSARRAFEDAPLDRDSWEVWYWYGDEVTEGEFRLREAQVNR